MPTLKSAFARSPLPPLEQRMLWEHILGVSRAWLIAHDTDPLPAQALQQYQQLEQRRVAGEPMAYIVGWREFMGHCFQVSPAVLIPRPETELLVEQVLHVLAQQPHAKRVVDLGTGSGAIAVSIALARPDLQVVATDFSTQALAVAEKNAHTLCAKVEFYQGSWYDAIQGHEAFDVIVSNPPYIAPTDTHLDQGDLRFEPLSALKAEQNGLADLAHIIAQAKQYLLNSGSIWLEHGWDQSEGVSQLLSQAQFQSPTTIYDLAGMPRITGAYS